MNFISDKNLVIPEYKIELLNKNKKTIKKIDNIETVENNLSKKDHIRKDFMNKKYNKNFRKNKFRKKFKHHQKPKKDNFEEKKLASY